MAQRLSPAILALILVAAACGSAGPSPSPAAASPSPTTPPSPSATPEPVAATGSPAASPSLAALKWIKFELIEQSGLSVPLDYADPSAGNVKLKDLPFRLPDGIRHLAVPCTECFEFS